MGDESRNGNNGGSWQSTIERIKSMMSTVVRIIDERKMGEEKTRTTTQKSYDGNVQRTAKLLFHILRAVTFYENTPEGNKKEFLEYIQTDIFEKTCQFVATFNAEEFSCLQKLFFDFLTQEWPKKRSFTVLQFLSDVYGFICKISPSAIAEEYLQVFSKPEMPSYIKLSLLPTIICSAPSLETIYSVTEDENVQSLVQFLQLKSCSTPEDTSELVQEFCNQIMSIQKMDKHAKEIALCIALHLDDAFTSESHGSISSIIEVALELLKSDEEFGLSFACTVIPTLVLHQNSCKHCQQSFDLLEELVEKVLKASDDYTHASYSLRSLSGFAVRTVDFFLHANTTQSTFEQSHRQKLMEQSLQKIEADVKQIQGIDWSEANDDCKQRMNNVITSLQCLFP